MNVRQKWIGLAIGTITSVASINTALSTPDNEHQAGASNNDQSLVSLANPAFTNMPLDQQISTLRTCFENVTPVNETLTTPAQQFEFAKDNLGGNTTYIEDGETVRYYTPHNGAVVRMETLTDDQGKQTYFGGKAIIEASSITGCEFSTFSNPIIAR